jgi:hypothetical protein
MSFGCMNTLQNQALTMLIAPTTLKSSLFGAAATKSLGKLGRETKGFPTALLRQLVEL